MKYSYYNDVIAYLSRKIRSNLLSYKILKDNEYLKQITIFEDMIADLVFNNNFDVDDSELKFNTKITNDDLFTLTYDFFKTLDKKTFELFEKLFKYHKKNVKLSSVPISKDYCGITYTSFDTMEFYIKIKRFYDIRDVNTLIHEYGHVLAFYLNAYDGNFYANQTPFCEIESIFLELLSFDFLDNIHFDASDSYNNRKNFIYDIYGKASNIDNKFVLYNNMTPNDRINHSYYSQIKQKFDIDKLDLWFMYSSPVEIDILYVISSLYAMELYDIYLKNKEKALELYKQIIKLDYPSNEEFVNELSNLSIYPNKTDTFIRTLKKDAK